jgi:DNA-damage-inducible protein D
MNEQIFEQIKKVNEYWKEYWHARELAKVLEYADFTNFSKVVKKAELACKNSGQSTTNHFSEFTETAQIGSWAKRALKSWKLSRYACYLIIQNADPSKEIVALWQSYFALQTRQQELSAQYLEDQKRLELRDEVTKHNKKLFSTARWAGVKDYATFYDSWYQWLYGLKKKDIIEKKHLDPEDNLLDHMNSEELAANLFRATQAEAKIKRESIKWQENASMAHFEVGQKIRQTIQELWWTMPEDIPAVEDIKYARRRLEELEYKEEWSQQSFEEKLAERLAEKDTESKKSVSSTSNQKPQSAEYKLPDNILLLTNLAKIIKGYPWDKLLILWDKKYKVSSEGLRLVKELMNK